MGFDVSAGVLKFGYGPAGSRPVEAESGQRWGHDLSWDLVELDFQPLGPYVDPPPHLDLDPVDLEDQPDVAPDPGRDSSALGVQRCDKSATCAIGLHEGQGLWRPVSADGGVKLGPVGADPTFPERMPGAG